MPKRLRRLPPKSEDSAQSAFRTLEHIIERSEDTPTPHRQNVIPIAERRRKNPAAVALGRKGGQKSAIARMKKIAPEERRRIASFAARERWKKAKG